MKLDPVARLADIKIAYVGLGLSGRTSNFQHLYSRIAPERRSQMVSLTSESGRSLFFDFIPEGLLLKGFRVRVSLLTAPGSIFNPESDEKVLDGADGVVCVVDSQESRLEASAEGLAWADELLRKQGRSLATIPLVFQYNKRDLPHISPLDELEDTLNRFKAPAYPASAHSGDGVLSTLRACVRRVLSSGPSASGQGPGES